MANSIDREFMGKVNVALLALEEMEPDFGVAVRLHDVEGMPHEEIAFEMDVPAEVAWDRVMIGRAALLRLVRTI